MITTDSLKKMYRWVLFAPVLLPLVYLNGIMYPMMTPKTLALRGLALIAVAFFAYLALRGEHFYFDRLKHWYTWVPGALLATAYATSLVGIDFYHSFWSTFERGDGLLTLTASVAYFYLILLAADEKFTRQLLHGIAWVGSVAGLYVLIQWLNINMGLDLSIIAKANGRVGGTMGNAAFLAAYLGITFFITLVAAPDYEGLKRKLLYWGAGFQIIGIVLAATRGTMLALLLVGALVLLHECVRGSGARRTWALRLIAGAVIAGALFFAFRSQITEIPFEPVRRLASISLEEGTVSSRLFLWQNLLPEALKSPLVGVGSEQIATLFNRIYDPTQIVEEWFDRSHNAYLDYLIQYGVIGAALYITLIAIALISSRRTAPLLFLAFATYAVQNFFVFDTGVTLWVLLALLALVFAKSSNTVSRALMKYDNSKWVGVVIAVVMLALLVPVVIQPLRANRLAFTAYLYHVSDVVRADTDTTKGLALNTYADLEFGYNAYFEYTNEQLPYFTAKAEKEKLVVAYQTALGVLSKNFERYPYDARTGVYLSHVLDTAPTGVTVDADFEQKVLQTTIELSAKRPEPWYILSNLAIGGAKDLPQGKEKTGFYKIAIQTLNTYCVLVPALAGPHFVLADLYLALDDTKKAGEEVALGKKYYKTDLLTARRAAVYFEKIGDWESAAFFLQEVVNEDESADTWHYDLAKAKYLLDDFAGAVEIVKYLRVHNPAILETDPAFLAAIAPYEQSH